jgi:altronate hydrolase
MNNIIILNEKDNVAIALYDIKKGTCIIVNDKSIEIKEDIGAGFKISITDISNKEEVIKFGYSIGATKTDIKKGEMIHINNMSSLV